MWTAVTPTKLTQYAVFGDASYSVTDQLKVDVGLRYYSYDTRFSSSIGGWDSALGAATPSATGLITQSADGVDPKFNISYDFTRDLKVYLDVAKGSGPAAVISNCRPPVRIGARSSPPMALPAPNGRPPISRTVSGATKSAKRRGFSMID